VESAGFGLSFGDSVFKQPGPLCYHDLGMPPKNSGLPQLTPDDPRRMLGEAIRYVKAQPQDQQSRADLFEALATQIESASRGAWTAARGRTIDGAEVFLGRQGEVVVISGDGRLFRGSIGNGVSVDAHGLRADYARLRSLG
jgi:hypothetical protein